MVKIQFSGNQHFDPYGTGVRVEQLAADLGGPAPKVIPGVPSARPASKVPEVWLDLGIPGDFRNM